MAGRLLWADVPMAGGSGCLEVDATNCSEVVQSDLTSVRLLDRNPNSGYLGLLVGSGS